MIHSRLQRRLSGIIGNALEWYDFALYGSFASLFAQLFFPKQNHLAAMLGTFGIFAAGFFTRPLGGLIFGHFGDRVGRRHMLVITIVGITCPTVFIGFLPSYESIGILAPIGLFIARLLQGLAIGGEYTGAVLFLAEDVACHQRGKVAALAMMGAFAGLLFGSTVALLCSFLFNAAALNLWGWRLPFLLALPFGLLAYYLRRHMLESDVFLNFLKQKKTLKKPVITLMRSHWRQVLLIISVCAMNGVAQYLMFAYFPSLLSHSTHLQLNTILLLNNVGVVIAMLLMPVFAALSDHFGRRPIFIVAGLGFLFLSFPIFHLLTQPVLIDVISGISMYGILLGAGAAPATALYIETFPMAFRYSGIAISYNLAFALFAGTAPFLATLLQTLFQSPIAPAGLLVFASAMSLVCFYFMPETAKKELAE